MGIYDVKLNKPNLSIATKVTVEGINGEIIKTEGTGNTDPFPKEDYLIIELEKPLRGCLIIEQRKDSFNYLTK